MKDIVAKKMISKFNTFEQLAKWLSKYHVYSVYGKQVESCWKTYKAYKPEDHQLDYFIKIFKNQAGKLCLIIERRMLLTKHAPELNYAYVKGVGHYKDCPVCIGECICG